MHFKIQNTRLCFWHFHTSNHISIFNSVVTYIFSECDVQFCWQLHVLLFIFNAILLQTQSTNTNLSFNVFSLLCQEIFYSTQENIRPLVRTPVLIYLFLYLNLTLTCLGIFSNANRFKVFLIKWKGINLNLNSEKDYEYSNVYDPFHTKIFL